MAEIVMVPGGEVYASLQLAIERHIGIEAQVCNFTCLLEVALDYMFMGQTFCKFGTVEQMIEGYGIPREDAVEIAYQLRNHLEWSIARCLGPIHHTVSYSFQINQFGDIQIISLCENWTPPPAPDTILETIQEDLANGDWYPERIRKLAGYR